MKDIIGLAALAGPLTLLALIGLAFLVVIPLAVRYAARHGRSKWRWGIGAFLLVYLPIFWDWIPTVVAHKYYCEKEAGFWVYKSLDQWKAENPGGMEGLITQRVWPHKYVGNDKNYVVTEAVNQRFNLITKKDGEFFLYRWRWQRELMDTRTNELLARYVDFSTGNGHIGGEPELRFWLHNDYCINGRDQGIKFGNFFEQFKGAEK